MTPSEVTANAGVGLSAGAASVSWVATANEYLQMVATVIAIIAGAAAAWYHIKQSRKL